MMLDFSKCQIYLATEEVDFRKSIDGLAIIVADAFEHNPGDGSVYVFYNKAKNKIKLIHHDGTGFMLCYKRLDKGKLIIKNIPNSSNISLDEEQLCWLMRGLDFSTLTTLPERYKNYN